MRPWSAQDVLTVWEIGQSQHAIERALTILKWAYPEKSDDELWSMSVGQRDVGLLTVYDEHFGSSLQGYAECPGCGECLEFTVKTSEIGMNDPATRDGEPTRLLELPEHDLVLTFRLSNSSDLAAIRFAGDSQAAGRLLAKRCLVSAGRQGSTLEEQELTSDLIAKLAARCAQEDPQAEVLIELHCPACDNHWTQLLDILEFLWAGVCRQARQLLRDVHILASAYGWRESDILSLSPARRQFYLEMAG